jgi:hypothetical protein
MLEADIRNPFRIMSNLETTARNMGGKRLQIEATFANPRLRSALERMYGMTEDPHDELVDIIVRDLTKGPK